MADIKTFLGSDLGGCGDMMFLVWFQIRLGAALPRIQAVVVPQHPWKTGSRNPCVHHIVRCKYTE